MRLWPITTKNKCFEKMLQHLLCSAFGLFNWHGSYSAYIFFFFFFSNQLMFFFFLNIYVSWSIYCYIDTTNFTIFSQLLMCQFLTSRNKNNKIWNCDQSQLKINVLRKCYNTYCAVLLVYSIGTVATMPKVFFFFF